MTTIETTSVATVNLPTSALLDLAKTLDPEWAKVADGFTVANSNSRLVGSDAGLTITFRKNETVDTAKVKDEPVMTMLDSPPAPDQEQRDEIRRVLESKGSDSFGKASPEVQEQVITKCLELLDGKPFSYNWYLDNIFYPLYDKLNQQFSFVWEPTDDQKREAKAILGIRIPFGQLSEEDKDKAVLEVLRKWHEDGEKEILRNADLYVNYFKGSELYLTTEFGKANQGRI